MMKKTFYKKGFSLIEVLISLSVLIMVVISATSLLVSAIRTNADNINMIVANGLAQEGLEAVRSIRDSNWLLGADFSRGGLISYGSSNKITLWGSKLPDNADFSSKYYVLDYQNPGDFNSFTGGHPNTGDNAISPQDAPWSLTEIAAGQSDCTTEYSPEAQFACSPETMLYKKQSLLNNDVYSYTAANGDDAVPTQYHRFISVRMLNHQIKGDAEKTTLVKNKKYLVTCHVSWSEAGSSIREVVLSTELTDWKEI